MQTLETSPYARFTRAIKTEATRRVYDNSLGLFMKYCEFIDYAKLLEGSNEDIEDRIMNFVAAQSEDGLSSAIIQTRLAAIKLFYDMNRRTLAWRLIRKGLKSTPKRKDRGYTKEEITKLLELADIRSKLIILLLSSSGMRIGGVVGLKKEHLTPIDKYAIYKITVYEGHKEEYRTYCSPECRKAIDDYFAYRERCGEKLTKDSPLLRKEFDKTDMRQVKDAKPISEITANMLIRRLMIDAGIRERRPVVEGQNAARIRREIKTLHGFRKYFDTVTTTAGISTVCRYARRS